MLQVCFSTGPGYIMYALKCTFGLTLHRGHISHVVHFVKNGPNWPQLVKGSRNCVFSEPVIA